MIVAFVALKLVTVPDAETRLAMFALVIVVVARADVPVTANVPVVVAFVVDELPTVSVWIVANIALKNEVKRFVEDPVVAKKLVAVAEVKIDVEALS